MINNPDNNNYWGFFMSKKFIDEVSFDDYEVLTPDGFKDFKGICKTIPYQVYEIKFTDGNSIKCADTHIFISNNNQIFAKDLTIGSVIDGKTPSIVSDIIIHDDYENMYDLKDVDGSVYYTNNVVSHNTTTIAAYVVWFAIFNKDKTIGIASNKQISAIDILTRIKKVYQELPVWMKPGVIEWSKTFVTFENGTRIMVSATSEDAFRGRTLNLLCLDEFAFIPKSVSNAFWAANYPTISASTDAKIAIISTPCGMYGQFYTLYKEAERGENTFKHFKSTWKDVPGRDEEWAIEQEKNLGKVRFAQEYGCSFLGSSNTLLTTETIEFLFATYQKAPIHIDLMGKFRIYEKPKPGCEYVIGVDSSKGTGGDSSVIQVLKMKSMKPIAYEQVAVYQNNTVDIYMFTDIVHRISVYYNNAYIMVENNAEGSTVVNKLWWDIETDKLVNTGSKQVDLGIRATRNTKPRAVMLLKKLIEDHSLKINDKETVEQLSSFIEDKGKFYGQNLHDDLVSGLQWATYITELNIFDETAKLKESVEEGKEVDVWGLLSDVNTITSDDFEFNGSLFSS